MLTFFDVKLDLMSSPIHGDLLHHGSGGECDLLLKGGGGELLQQLLNGCVLLPFIPNEGGWVGDLLDLSKASMTSSSMFLVVILCLFLRFTLFHDRSSVPGRWSCRGKLFWL